MRIPQKVVNLSTRRSILLPPIVIAAVVVLLMQSKWIKKNQDLFRSSTVIEQVRCWNCEGTGLTRDPDARGGMTMCPICFGVGRHLARRMTTNDHICPACNGMGRLFDPETGEARTCGRCGGRGLIVSEGGREEE